MKITEKEVKVLTVVLTIDFSELQLLHNVCSVNNEHLTESEADFAESLAIGLREFL